MKQGSLFLAAIMIGACTPAETGEPPGREPASNAAGQPTDVAANATEAPVAPAPSASPQQQSRSPCLTQDGEELEVQAVKAIGTEPFWGARTEGRCVTYSTPEDQKGTRIWTHVDTGPQGPVWNGALRGRQFQLYVKTSTGCSDGMSDKTYPLEAVLRVDGETRRGCAEPL